MDQINLLWQQGGFTPPSVLWAMNMSGEFYLVISDNATIIRLMNRSGKMYAVAKFRCGMHPEQELYVCQEPIHIIGCETLNEPIEAHARQTVLPFFNQLLKASQ